MIYCRNIEISCQRIKLWNLTHKRTFFVNTAPILKCQKKHMQCQLVGQSFTPICAHQWTINLQILSFDNPYHPNNILFFSKTRKSIYQTGIRNKTLKYKLGQNIWLRKIIQKYSVLISTFSNRIGSKQEIYNATGQPIRLANKINIFLKLNNVEYCPIMLNNVYFGIFSSFLIHFDIFLHYLTRTNKKLNNYLFWINFSDLIQIIYSF